MLNDTYLLKQDDFEYQTVSAKEKLINNTARLNSHVYLFDTNHTMPSVSRSQWNKKEECQRALAHNKRNEEKEIERTSHVRPRDFRQVGVGVFVTAAADLTADDADHLLHPPRDLQLVRHFHLLVYECFTSLKLANIHNKDYYTHNR